jgi:GTP cyclohydrolase IA
MDSKTSRRPGGTLTMKSGDDNGGIALGRKVHAHLLKLGIETPFIAPSQNASREIQMAFLDILRELGLDLKDDSLRETPFRVAKMYTQEIFWGLNYANFPNITTITNKMRYDELIATKCTVRSVCEHHFVPFIGIAWVGYLPKTKILGLSKFNRVVDFFSRRPQVQERLTAQVTATLQFVLETKDVACVIRATHFCVGLRGIKDHQSETITSQMGGRFLQRHALRQEFLDLTR